MKPAHKIVTMSIDAIVPYHRNPRRIDKAVEVVAESISRYGYQSPIVVDQKNIIIAGHTRYAALRKLGYTEVNVVVANLTAKEAKELRLADNKTAEYATWTEDLGLELRELSADMDYINIFFEDFTLGQDFLDMPKITIDDVLSEEDRLSSQGITDLVKSRDQLMIEIRCPECLEVMKVKASDLIAKIEDERISNAKSS